MRPRDNDRCPACGDPQPEPQLRYCDDACLATTIALYWTERGILARIETQPSLRLTQIDTPAGTTLRFGIAHSHRGAMKN